MDLANKLDAVTKAYTTRVRARERYATLADAGDEHARDEIRRIGGELERLRAEALRLKAERAGSSDAAGSRASRYHDAIGHTRRIEAEFHQDLGRLGWYQQTASEVRREIEERALAYVRDNYGEHAARHCRRLLAPREATPPVGPLSVPLVPR
jgi:small-conductance mechanosensitive channel